MHGLKWIFKFLVTIKSAIDLSCRPANNTNSICLETRIAKLNETSKLNIAKDIFHAFSLEFQFYYKEECIFMKAWKIRHKKVDFNLNNLFSSPQINKKEVYLICQTDMKELLLNPISNNQFYIKLIAPLTKKSNAMCHSCREKMADLFYQIKNQLSLMNLQFIIEKIIERELLNIFLLIISVERFEILVNGFGVNFNGEHLKFFTDLFSKALEIYHIADNRQLLIKLYARFALLEEYFKKPQSDDNFLFRFYKNHSPNLGINYLDDKKKLGLFNSMITYSLENTKIQEIVDFLKLHNFNHS